MPILGAVLGGVGRRLAGKALRWATRGKLLGSGGGRAIAGRVAQGVGAISTVATGVSVLRSARNAMQPSSFGSGGSISASATMAEDGERKKYRRMNVGNGRALRRAVRRVEMFERMARRVFTVTEGTLKLKKRRSSR